ncbi:30S ribosomal protein S17e [Haladaptatus paucihalophilus DX253]|uniref:Small ribosomal subunit protein eS17 n=1 Tax=Haladaptatus paucihalophilus DX253 TaxID=797209 RepID=E7QX32_HALPU|nr:30S ribosomal protein S17e [Haladaptatus paucihalophilus]EFW90835.1 30S ribosomal protein S17e [Haladaptatus paucihalophilus DX253]SHK23460.1 SSU ribosomal protein S17E [Haladaptatus paucihalophilus DX253]
MPVQPDYVKKVGGILLERYPEAFTDDFDRNKESVTVLTNVDSKSVRNRIAGYITRRGGEPPRTVEREPSSTAE